MPLPARTAAAALTFAALTPALASAATIWEGTVDSDWFNAANWSNGVPNDNPANPATVASGTPNAPTIAGNNFDGDILQTGNTVSIDHTNQVRYNRGVYTLSGGTLDLVSNNLRLNTNSTTALIIDGGTLADTGTADAIEQFGVDSTFDARTAVNLPDTTYVHRDGLLKVDATTMTVGTYLHAFNGSTAALTLELADGATFNTAFLSYGAGNNSDLGTISFSGSASALNATTWNTNREREFQIDFAASSVGSTFTVGADFFTEAEWISQFNLGELTIDGGTPDGSFNDFFEVTDGTLTFVAIPEPGALGLVSLGLLVMLRRR